MYKKAPNQYREDEEFYPLQLRYVLNENPANLEGEACWRQKIAYAAEADIPEWMDLVHLVVDGFSHLDEEQYLEQLREYIRNRRALILKDANTVVGIMAFNEMTGALTSWVRIRNTGKRGLQKHFVKRHCTNWYALKRSLSRLSERATWHGL